MKGFIEITEKIGNCSVLCPIDKITAIVDLGYDGVFIETGFDGRGKSTGISASDMFDTVKQKIINCEG